MFVKAIRTCMDLAMLHSHFTECKHELLKAMDGGSATTFGASYSAMLNWGAIEPVIIIKITKYEVKTTDGF